MPIAATAFFEDRLASPGQPAAWLFEQPVAAWALSSLPELSAALGEAEAQGWWTVWALDYELGYRIEPAGAPPGWQSGPERPLARVWAFARCEPLSRAAADAWLDRQAPAQPAGIGGLAPGLDQEAYRAAVQAIQAYIQAGDCYQVNFTFPLRFEHFGSPLVLYRALARRQPVRYGGIVQADGRALLSLSPELFVARRGQHLVTRPMKGTAPRQADPQADQAAARELAASGKNRAENLMIVDLLRNDLGRLASPGSVQVSALFAVESYPTVHQMVSQVEAEVPVRDDGALLRALFPCGSITGAPKVRAMQIIGELEREPRGLYTGALGWCAPDGELRLNVAIRTLELEADGRGRMGVGSGIVADSEAGAEWRECLLKGRFLTDLDPGLQLIETLRLEVRDGIRHFPRLEGHRQRMEQSAAWLGFPWSRVAMDVALAGEPLADGCYRLRLALDKAGAFQVRCVPLDPEPEGERLLLLAGSRIDAGDPLRRHKTTARSQYDQALAALAGQPQVFDVLFLNQAGQVAEGARSNVFVRRGERWLTPPLSSGALPGVLRAELLASGLVQEAGLDLADLRGADEIRCGNALRGWVRVSLREDRVV